jgi:hypothetical protein
MTALYNREDSSGKQGDGKQGDGKQGDGKRHVPGTGRSLALRRLLREGS